MYLKRFLAAVLVLCSAVFMFPAFSAAGSQSFDLWVSPTGEKTIEAINVMNVIDQQYYLFLPAKTDISEWKIGCSLDSVTVNDVEIVPGETCASLLKEDGPNAVKAYGSRGAVRKLSFTVMRGSDIPAMYITTESGSLQKIHKSKKVKEAGSMLLYDTDGSVVYNGGLKHIKMRGNASTRYKKKNYAIKLENGTNLLGMGKAKKWILIGNMLDKSLIRNQLNFDMARYAGIPYTPDCRQVAVYVNNDYYGMFLLTEKIEIDDDRVAIRNLEKETEALNDQKLEDYPVFSSPYARHGGSKGRVIPNEPEDVTGGYLIEFEFFPSKFATEESAYVTTRNYFLIIHSPEYCSERQMQYISGLFQGFENAIYSGDGRDPETGKHYSEFVDFDSLVNKYLINEVSKNYDANKSSEYFFKPDDSVSEKIFAGPVWDLDNTYGVYALPGNTRVLNPRVMYVDNRKTRSYWWPALSRQKDFHEAVVNRYHSTFKPALEILLGKRAETETLKSIDTYAEAIRASAEMEYVRYPGLQRPQGNAKIQTGKNHAENIAYLKDYIEKRMEFLSSEWPQEQ